MLPVLNQCPVENERMLESWLLLAEGSSALIPPRPVPHSWLVPNTSWWVRGQVGSDASTVPFPPGLVDHRLSDPQKSEGFLLCWDTEVALSSHQSPLCAKSPVLLFSLLCFQNFTEALERNLKQRAKIWLLDQFSHFLAGHSHLISPAASFVQQG